MAYDIAIVTIAYNRLNSIKRLLTQLSQANYNQEVTLIISIDFSSESSRIEEFAREFEWKFGSKKIIAHNENLGLRKHVLKCGDLTKDYDAIVMFEDDIIPSPYFFTYINATLQKYGEYNDIGGISLYSPNRNEMVELPFSPLHIGHDVYFLKSASSWGQCWTKKMWKDFREWYDVNNSDLKNEKDLPDKIYSWPDTSWKKYYMKYLVECNKYFVYPYQSLSTNFSDVGSHVKKRTTLYQVPLVMGKIEYNLPDLSDGIKYDQYFENENIKKYFISDNILENQIVIDLYGDRQSYDQFEYILTTKKLNQEVICSFGMHFKPIEMNIILNNEGNDISLYKNGRDVKMRKTNNYIKLEYYSSLNWKSSMIYTVNFLIQRVRKLIF